MALRKPTAQSEAHWSFQSVLNKPHRDNDALMFSSGHGFSLAEAPAWWLCFDTLKMVDGELRQVDALLADKRMNRLAVRRVAAIESPERISVSIPTDGWKPIDIDFHIGNVPDLIHKLGGEELYGKSPELALRELVQNASDAIRARILHEGRAPDWGKISVRVREIDDVEWLEIEDNGIGMSLDVVRNYLLNFGSSFWDSNDLLREFPGLARSGLSATGKYGIGFFSIFMLGEKVEVRTRRADLGQKDSIVVEIDRGLACRPIVRDALAHEQLKDGGSCVRVRLRSPSKDSLLPRGVTLIQLCEAMFPALDTDLVVSDSYTLKRDGWLKSDNEDFLKMICRSEQVLSPYEKPVAADLPSRLAPNVEFIRDDNGVCQGRGCLSIPDHGLRWSEHAQGIDGLVAIGGIAACQTVGFTGILNGTSLRAARDEARPNIDRRTLRTWASSQAEKLAAVYSKPQEQLAAAAVVRKCGGDTGPLAIAFYKGRWLSMGDFESLDGFPDEPRLADYSILTQWSDRASFKCRDDVFYTATTWHGLLAGRGGSFTSGMEWWPDFDDSAQTYLYLPEDVRALDGMKKFFFRMLAGLVAECIAKRWAAPLGDVLKRSTTEYTERPEEAVAHLGGEPLTSRVYIMRKN
jgi:hypothetical protein